MIAAAGQPENGASGSVAFGIFAFVVAFALWRYRRQLIEYNSRKDEKHLGGAYSELGKRISSAWAGVIALLLVAIGILVIVLGLT